MMENKSEIFIYRNPAGEIRLDKSSLEYGKYKDAVKKIERVESFAELVEDIKKLKPFKDKGNP